MGTTLFVFAFYLKKNHLREMERRNDTNNSDSLNETLITS